MNSRGLKPALALSCGLLAFAANAGAALYHGGPVIISAKVVNIFWGPSFVNAASPDFAYAQTLQAFRNQFGTSPEYNILTQFYQLVGGVPQYIQLSNLGSGTADLFDTTTPPANVTETAIQNKVKSYLTTHAYNVSTIYEVFLPSTSYASSGSVTSCGGPSLGFCTYRNYYGSPATAVKYSVQPYPSCSSCQISGWTPAQNQENFVAQSTRTTVINPLFTGWYDATGAELQDKCAWSPTPFLDGGYGYPYFWSLAVSACVKTR